MIRWRVGLAESTVSSMRWLITHNCKSSRTTSSKYSRPWKVSQLRNLHNYGRERTTIRLSRMMRLLTLPRMISSIRTSVFVLFQVWLTARASRIERRRYHGEPVARMRTTDWTGTRRTNSSSRTRDQLLRREHKLTRMKSRESSCSRRGRPKRNDTVKRHLIFALYFVLMVKPFHIRQTTTAGFPTFQLLIHFTTNSNLLLTP